MTKAREFAKRLSRYKRDELGFTGIEYEAITREYKIFRYVDGRFTHNSIDSTELCVFQDGSILRVSNPREIEFPAFWEEIQVEDVVFGNFIVSYNKQ